MSIEFDAVDDIITVADSASLDITGDITLMAWIFKDTDVSFDTMLAKGNLIANDVTYFFMTNGDELFYGFRSATVLHEIQTDSANIPTGTWTHVAVVHDTVNDTITFYVNGVVEAATVISGTPLTTARIANNLSLFMGEDGDGFSIYDGRMEDMRIYNRVVTTDEILSKIAKRGTDADGPGLAAKWRMNERAPGTTASGADTVKDVSNNANHGTPTLGPVYRDSNLHFGKRVA